jgi:alpha-L-arabinofuranosidase
MLLAAAMVRGQSAATMNIQVNQPGAVVSSNLFGIFFEEINSAGDGGLYGELVRNRSFEDGTNSPVYWSLVTSNSATGQIALDTSAPMSAANLHSLALTKTGGSGSVGAANNGYWGIPLTNGATYNLQFYARGAAGFSGAVSVSLESTGGGTIYAQTNFTGLTTGWQHFTAALVAAGTDTNAQLVLRISQAGTVYLDFVSLFPAATFHDRTNGLRPDLANMLASLSPSFMRFPGGSWVDGMDLSNAYHWQPTVGFLPDRTVRTNIWGYMVDNGLGYHEYLQLCEDLGTEPLFDVNAGISGGASIAPANLGPWVQEALNAIQYANGDTGTTYGAMRAANGHPAPFNLKYIEIGNENGGTAYNNNYALFYDAIKSNYPAMHIIANDWGGIPSSRPVEIQDEHYYASASTFMGYATKYDSYSRSGPKVFVGEYAVAYNIGPGFLATLNNALGEAAFMTGMERNADIVSMACYAPLFANWNNQDWTPDLIYFNGTQAYGTPSFYVQQMFANNRGDCVLPNSIAASTNAPHGAIGLGSWSTSVQYTNVVVTSNGVVLYQSDFVNQGTNGWRVYAGNWSTNNGVYQQTNTTTTPAYSTDLNGVSTNWANYTISLRARKVSGSEGFLILFNWTDDNNWTWWNVGGWSNTKDGIEQMVNGTKTTVASVSQTTIANNTWYDISIVVSNYTMQCYLNGTLIQTVNYSSNAASGIFASTTYNRAAGQVIVKAVNPYNSPMTTTFNLAGVNAIASNATLVQLTSGSPADENSLASPTYVSPVTNAIASAGTNFTLTLPANSLSVLKLTASGINNYSNLLLQVPSPITNGITVASAVWAQQYGGWSNLTANANHALVWSSSNTNVAVVDIAGNVTGVAAGTANIIASYPALGLFASQNVSVVSVPVTLVHRYSFSETSGTNVADSVGGAAWNGTLPNGGSFSGSGQLALAANLQQYVALPAGIVSNYSAVTIEAWATFPNQLPGNCFFFGFGNLSGNTGYNYIFCQPKNGRIAITGSDYHGEQNTSPQPSGDWSYSTNLHITAVFNPPLGYLALYTNGVLAAINSSVTITMSSVTNLYSWIGRSLYSGDAYFNFSLDELRLYNGALTATDIAATDALGPDQVLSMNSPAVSVAAAGGNLTLTWPLAAAGYSVMTTTNLAAGNWTAATVSPQIVGGQWLVLLPMTNNLQFYQLQK